LATSSQGGEVAGVGVRADRHPAGGRDFKALVVFLHAEKTKLIAEVIRTRLAQDGLRENFQRKIFRRLRGSRARFQPRDVV
jgi:hypothetical protein